MKRTFIITDCLTQVSPDCTKTFQREVKQGRPRINCDACSKAKVKAFKTANSTPVSLDRQCPCGAAFTVKPGRGRKADKCDACRASGIVYRRDESGTIKTLTKDQALRENQERNSAVARERAMLLTLSMQKLHAKTDRKVIVH